MAHVLVVDDDTDTRNALRFAMEEVGHAVTEAADGQAALEALRAAPDGLIVLLDHLMPQMTGLDLLRVVAQDATLAHRHAYILLTASPHLSQAHLAAFDGHLHVALVAKPFDLDMLLQAIEQAAEHLDHEQSA